MPRLARENTLPSFALALDAGAEGIELDVHATSDGIVVVHHDPLLSDGASIRDLSHADLVQRSSRFGLALPTLLDVCELVGGRCELFVEIKGAGIENLVLDVLASYEGSFAIHSFDHALIARLHAQRPELRLGILLENDREDIVMAMMASGARDAWPHWTLITEAMIEQVHEVDGRVIAWTVNDAADAVMLREMAVDGLCSDDVRVIASA